MPLTWLLSIEEIDLCKVSVTSYINFLNLYGKEKKVDIHNVEIIILEFRPP
jgi:hypothetical protein